MTQNSQFRSDSSNLDLVRAVAVLSVFFAHLYDMTTGTRSLITWRFGQMGVLIFFVHTSFVLMLSLERIVANGGRIFEEFYLRRFFRIYPFAMFCVTVAMILHWSPEPASPLRYWKWTEYASNLALTTNLTYTDNMVGGLWTLPLEVQMYVALPFLFLLGRALSWHMMSLVWMASIPLAILQLNTSGRLSVLGYAPCFLAGVLAWKLSLTLNRRIPGWLWPLGFIAVWPLFFFATHENDMYFRWAFCIGLAFVIPQFGELSFAPLRAVAKTIATYSYGIYLSHVAIIAGTIALPLPLPFKLAAVAVLIVVVPVAVYRLIEHPMILLGGRIASRQVIPKPAVCSAAAGFSGSNA